MDSGKVTRARDKLHDASGITRRSLLTATMALGTVGPPAADSADRLQPSTRLQFQSSFWVNLHHFLRAEARRSSRGANAELRIASLLPDEATLWKAALSFYQGYAAKSLLFDATLRDICNRLSDCRGDADQLAQRQLPDGDTRRALNAAAPAYCKYLWNSHGDENDRWIAQYGPLARHYEHDARSRLEAVFEVRLPARPLRVDLARDVGPTLAYTFTPGPRHTAGHTVLAPQQNRNPDTAMDTVFHEVWHTVDQHLVDEVNREASRQGVKAPPDLWHGIGLYTTCFVVQRLLGKEADAQYAPRAALVRTLSSPDSNGLYTVLEQMWEPYLAGQRSRRQALEGVIRAAGVPE